ncbi:MAG: hypothetical protein HQM09_02955 [Candidatus Riflebacteria bacterium]|nr:hypothetical protein [Candidatus Riflebacteria bacterium]
MSAKTILEQQPRGFVLPLVFCLVGIMLAFGGAYFFSTLQSKNSFQVFFRDEVSRIIAESALAEWRATFISKRMNDPVLKSLIQNPKTTSSAVAISSDDLPRTKELATKLLGAGRWALKGKVSVQNIDNELIENVAGISKRGAFGNEYQGTLKVDFSVVLGPANQSASSKSSFSFEFDIKYTCLRSKPADRLNRGYTSNALNDYVLYIRDGQVEFASPANWSLRNTDRTLTLGHSDPAKPGKIFLGGADATTVAAVAACGKILFSDTNDHLESKLPDPPLIGKTGPVGFDRFLPFSTQLLRSFTFKDSKELFHSPFYDGSVLKLDGIFFIEDSVNGLVIPKGLKYEGKGILISYGDIKIEGSFKKKSSSDGPCVLYTWVGKIFANAVEQGRIEASLVALKYNYAPTNPDNTKSAVDFSQRKAEVLGNLLADRLNLESMSSNQTNSITYDNESFQGDELYTVTLGGRLRKMEAIFSDKSPQ